MSSKDLYLRLLSYVRPHTRVFALAIFATLVTAATEPMIPALIKPLLDGSFVAKDPFFIQFMPLALAALFVVRGTSGFAAALGLKWVANQVVMDLRTEMFAKLLQLPAHHFADTSGGVLLSKFTYDVTQVMNAATQSLLTFVRDSLAVLGLLIWIFYLNWQLSLITLLLAPLIAVAVRIIGKRLRRLSNELQNKMGTLNHVIDETIEAHREIKIFGGEAYERERFHRINNSVRRFNIKLAVAAEASVPIIQFFAVIALATVIYIASLQSAAGDLTVGGFVSLIGAMAMLLAPIKRLTRLNEPLQRGLAAAQSVFALIDETPEPDFGSQTLHRAQGDIRFRSVCLRYRTDTDPVLQNINLTVAAGETIALVGPSGGGKTSLINLLPRFYQPDDGQILLDGVDIAAIRLADLRANIAYVGQHVVLFDDTVTANIAYGMRELDPHALRHAAAAANALEFIEALPQGFETLIGENGARLSGGQRQRIAIARALLKDAPILILDEATSALDTQSERKVQQALEQLRRGRTAFIVAHRLSTIENADRIVVLQHGRIVEIGSHRELLAQDSVYAGLYRNQIQPPDRNG